ncbi:MAG: hypothetical protein CMN97_09520 [Synechococcus sp. NAT40]|uniref:DUF2973 domain-containing protein n=1 Tax=Synechococcus sp. MIT S9451 TaxID=3082543 RepID=UPI000C901147|nr:hypothetical protein [Synechococcus sp. NAT40]
MLSALFPLAYAAVLICLLLQAFRMMRMATSTTPSAMRRSQDRTGLRTVHPELLNEHGQITDEELWTVRFSDQEGFAPSQG